MSENNLQFHPTQKALSEEQRLKLLSLTMISPHIYVAGGLVARKVKNKLYSAQSLLRDLTKKGLADYRKCKSKCGIQNFYYLPGRKTYHKINKHTWIHDSITALFLTHLFRSSLEYNIELRWYPPFSPTQTLPKFSDGGVALYYPKSRVALSNQKKETVRSILLETDTGSHDHKEIWEKIASYQEFLFDNPHRVVVFLVLGTQRANNIRKTVQDYLEMSGKSYYQKQIFFFTPVNFPPDMDVVKKLMVNPGNV